MVLRTPIQVDIKDITLEMINDAFSAKGARAVFFGHNRFLHIWSKGKKATCDYRCDVAHGIYDALSFKRHAPVVYEFRLVEYDGHMYAHLAEVDIDCFAGKYEPKIPDSMWEPGSPAVYPWDMDDIDDIDGFLIIDAFELTHNPHREVIEGYGEYVKDWFKAFLRGLEGNDVCVATEIDGRERKIISALTTYTEAYSLCGY